MSHFLISNDREQLIRMTTAIDIGVLGPWSGTRLLNTSQNGWDNQVKTDLILAYRAKFEKGIFEVQGADAQLFGQANVGSFRPSLGVGGQLRMGLLNPYFYALHTAPRSLLGSGKIHDRQVYGFVNGGIDLIGYDASLQGGMINGGLFGNEAYELTRRDINRLVAYLELGFNVSFRGLMIGYSHNFRSKTFKLGTRHSWGRYV